MTLEQAREAARVAQSELRAGLDPIDTRRARRREAIRQSLQAVTFGHCTERYIEAHRAAWRNANHAAQWRSTLHIHAASLVPRPVADMDDAAVLQALEPIRATKTETATRLRQRMEAVLDWAAAGQCRRGDNPARWRGHLDHVLPTPGKLKARQPRPALPYAEAPPSATSQR